MRDRFLDQDIPNSFCSENNANGDIYKCLLGNKTATTGINIRNVNMTHFITPFSDVIEYQQAVGRTCRRGIIWPTGVEKLAVTASEDSTAGRDTDNHALAAFGFHIKKNNLNVVTGKDGPDELPRKMYRRPTVSMVGWLKTNDSGGVTADQKEHLKMVRKTEMLALNAFTLEMNAYNCDPGGIVPCMIEKTASHPS